MSERDWDRFGDYLRDLGNTIPPIHDRYILFAGIAGGGLVGFLGWLAVWVTITDPGLGFFIIGFAILAITGASAGIARSNRETEDYLTKKLRRDSDLLWKDMDRTHPFSSPHKEG